MEYKSSEQVIIGTFEPDRDDIEELTDLLHRAYQQLADMGLRYLATHQDSSITLRRIDGGRCLVGLLDNRIVATITYYRPGVKSDCAWYAREGVGTFGQFGVLPEFQGSGVGSQLLDAVEQMAVQDQCLELALDTAEPAVHLHRYYQNRGYRIVDSVDWDGTNYKSVIMSKKL